MPLRTVELGTTAATRDDIPVAWGKFQANDTELFQKVDRAALSPLDFGAVGDGTTNDTTAIQNCIAQCISQRKFLDLRGATGWRIRATLSFQGLAGVIASWATAISVDVTGTYTNGYAIEIANPVPGPYDNAGRNTGFTLLGHLAVNATSRSTALHGVYVRGSFINIQNLRATGFNGTGVNFDSVWDSWIGRVSVELCGNVSSYALVFSSVGDTYNCTTVVSLQVEQAYQRGLYINAIRAVFLNLHCERMSITSTNTGDTIQGTANTYINHYILLSNSSVDQSVFDCLSSGTAPDGTALAATQMKMVVGGDNSEIRAMITGGALVYSDYGNRLKISTMTCDRFQQRSPASNLTLQTCNITTLSLEGSATVIGCTIGTFDPQFNGRWINVYGGAITTVAFTANIKGSIFFHGVVVGTVGDTRQPTETGRAPTTFNGCEITTLNGAYQYQVVLNGGYVHTASLADRARAQLNDVQFGTFAYTGSDPSFVSRNCRATTVTNWAVPDQSFWPVGTVTERIGYNVAGKLYQCTDSAVPTWTLLV